MKYFRHAYAGKQATVFPIVCMHVGVAQSNDGFIKEHIQRIIADPDGFAVYLGDAGECSLKTSKGDVYSQYLNPGEQLDYAEELLAPLGAKLLWGIRGNHGNRIYKETGLDWDQQLCIRLGIPYLGQACFMRLEVGKDKAKVNYDCYFHHGSGGSINIGGKVNKALRFNQLVHADAVFTAHSHIANDNPPETIAYLPTTKREIAWHTQRSYICGCGYDSRTGYAEERAYPPILPAYLGVTFKADNDHRGTKRQQCQIWRAEA